MLDFTKIRAYRNHNPGNIRQGIRWHGLKDPAHMTPEQKAETQFCVFENPAEGFRAMATILRNYKKLHAIHTIRGIISRWAPPTENNTGAYVNSVCNKVGMMPDADFPFDDRAMMILLCKAIAIHECGGWFFSESDLAKGVGAVV